MADLNITESDAVESTSVGELARADIGEFPSLYIDVSDTTTVTDVETIQTALVINEYDEVTVADVPTVFFPLKLDATLSDLQIDAAMGQNLWTDPADMYIEGRSPSGYGWLTDLRIDAATDIRTLEVDGGLSDLQCEGHMGASTRVDELDPLYLPELQGEGAISEDPVISLDATLSPLEGEGSFGAFLDERLSELRVEAEVSGVGGISVDVWLPGLEIEASVISETFLSLDKNLTFLIPDAYIQESLDLQLDSILPGLVLAGRMLLGTVLTLDATLSDLQGEATVLSETYLSLDGYLSPLVVVIADGEEGGDGQKSSVSEDDRFEDYIMRYSRW